MTDRHRQKDLLVLPFCFFTGGDECIQAEYLQTTFLSPIIHFQAGVDVNLQDMLGDTPLHKAACTGRKVRLCDHKATACIYSRTTRKINLTSDGHSVCCFGLPKEIVLLLLRYAACANIINGTAQIPKDVTEDDEIITMLEGIKSQGFFCFVFPSLILTSHYRSSAVLGLKYCLVCAAAERREMRRREEKLLQAAREGDLSTLSKLVSA